MATAIPLFSFGARERAALNLTHVARPNFLLSHRQKLKIGSHFSARRSNGQAFSLKECMNSAESLVGQIRRRSSALLPRLARQSMESAVDHRLLALGDICL